MKEMKMIGTKSIDDNTDFKVNDIVKCKKDIVFTDGTSHSKGENMKVTEKTKYYFNNKCNRRNYECVGYVYYYENMEELKKLLN